MRLEIENQYLVSKYTFVKGINECLIADSLYNAALEESENYGEAGDLRSNYIRYGKDLFYDPRIWWSQEGWTLHFITQMRQHYEDLVR